MTRQLRLASGVLTDVGRKRERNQDNVTSEVPTAADILEERGALFVVCDGMGGHAAGEVASELGVRTIREVYFASQGQDVITSIAQAVKSANDAIYSLARSHTEYSGMGTTCVTLVIVGGRAYIVNIGDSRAYIIRDGQMRQVTQDHSWVAEQVRIGLLTEEQARVHAHRNVITRSLGTQPNITADLFVETLRDGDRVLLCSDGLHGYVEEGAISQEVATQASPEQAARDLIDMANANGGPDNISAIVVDVLEAPEVTGPIPLPANADEPIEEGTTQPLPVPTGIAPAAAVAASATATASTVANQASSPASTKKKGRARQSRKGLLLLRLLEVAAVLLVMVTVWYVGFGPLATQRATTQQGQNRLITAHNIIRQAGSQSPALALQSLAQARALALADVTNPTLDSSVRAQAQSLLDQELTPAVQQALQRYNTAALITQAAVNTAVSYTINCVAAAQSAATPITATSGLVTVSAPAGKPALIAGQQIVFFISGGALYEALIPVDTHDTPTSGATICAPVTVKGVSAYLSIAVDGQTVYALAQQAAGGYGVVAVAPGALGSNGAPTVKTNALFAVPVTQETPTHLTVAGKSLYISYAGGATTPFGVWLFNGQPKTPGGPEAPAQTIALPAAASNLLASNNSLYMLLADGSLGQLDVSHLYTALVVVASPPATTNDPATYTAATPVPTPASPAVTQAASGAATATPVISVTAGATATPNPALGATFSAGATLIADPLTPTNILLSDPANSRIIRLVTTTNGPGVGLVGQYVYSAPITNVSDAAVTGAGSTLNAFVWSGSHLVTFPLPEPAPGA